MGFFEIICAFVTREIRSINENKGIGAGYKCLALNSACIYERREEVYRITYAEHNYYNYVANYVACLTTIWKCIFCVSHVYRNVQMWK